VSGDSAKQCVVVLCFSPAGLRLARHHIHKQRVGRGRREEGYS